jgi:hypothetical protein
VPSVATAGRTEPSGGQDHSEPVVVEVAVEVAEAPLTALAEQSSDPIRMRRARARARTRAIRPSRAGGTTVLIGLPRGRNFPVVILPAPVPRAQNFLELGYRGRAHRRAPGAQNSLRRETCDHLPGIAVNRFPGLNDHCSIRCRVS